jgi:hypothetical protein
LAERLQTDPIAVGQGVKPVVIQNLQINQPPGYRQQRQKHREQHKQRPPKKQLAFGSVVLADPDFQFIRPEAWPPNATGS